MRLFVKMHADWLAEDTCSVVINPYIPYHQFNEILSQCFLQAYERRIPPNEDYRPVIIVQYMRYLDSVTKSYRTAQSHTSYFGDNTILGLWIWMRNKILFLRMSGDQIATNIFV